MEEVRNKRIFFEDRIDFQDHFAFSLVLGVDLCIRRSMDHLVCQIEHTYFILVSTFIVFSIMPSHARYCGTLRRRPMTR